MALQKPSHPLQTHHSSETTLSTSTQITQAGMKRARKSSNDLSAVKRPAYRSPPLIDKASPQQAQTTDAAKIARQKERAAWDSQSKIYLTYRALRELNQRNKESFKRRKIHQPSSDLFISEATVVELKRFARGGGPNLRSLRNVKCFSPF